MQLRGKLKQDLRAALAGDDSSRVPADLALEPRRCHAEALLRWHHRARGERVARRIHPDCRGDGPDRRLGSWVLREASRVAATWPREIRIAVNLSPLQLGRRARARRRRRSEPNGLAPSRLELEITESALLAENAATRAALVSCALSASARRSTISVPAIPSLRSLRSFPVDKIKIDKSFVGDIGRNADSAAIIRAVIGLAHDLGLKTAAEGIETEGQLQWLALQGCTEGQGHFFSEPVSTPRCARCSKRATPFR